MPDPVFVARAAPSRIVGAFCLTSAFLAGCAMPPVAVPASEFPPIIPVSSLVPKDCAAFLGGWAGTWPYGNFGQLRLWVTHIDESCVATYTYAGRAGSSKIQNGTLPVRCGGGTCYFSVSGDSLAASYSAQDSQRTSFARIVRAP